MSQRIRFRIMLKRRYSVLRALIWPTMWLLNARASGSTQPAARSKPPLSKAAPALGRPRKNPCSRSAPSSSAVTASASVSIPSATTSAPIRRERLTRLLKVSCL